MNPDLDERMEHRPRNEPRLARFFHAPPPERLDAFNETTDMVERHIHLNRYTYVADFINNLQPKDTPILIDAACGLGYGSYLLSGATKCIVYGIDLSGQAVAYARAHYSKANTVHFAASSIAALPFDQNAFSFFVCLETIEHLPRGDAEKAVTEIRRVLKAGGLLFISSPNRLITGLLELILKTSNPFHCHEYTPRELHDMLSTHDFILKARLGQCLYIPLISRFLMRLFPEHYSRPSKYIPVHLSNVFLYCFQNMK
jgi:2-polyprenyl-3-methyl-5-hydroxy-6-metoxy-1,4-benzoquinol methylase